MWFFLYFLFFFDGINGAVYWSIGLLVFWLWIMTKFGKCDATKVVQGLPNKMVDGFIKPPPSHSSPSPHI